MLTYVIRRFLLIIPTLFIASLIIFFTIRLLPGDIVSLIAAQMEGAGTVNKEAIRHMLGLDVPAVVQYGRWIGGILLHGDFGTSMWTGVPVADEIFTRWPVTLELGILSLVISQIIALPVGIYSALRQDTWGDYISRSTAIFFMAAPGFWIATLAIVFGSIWWGWSPPIILASFADDPIGNLKMFIVPAIIMGMVLSGSTMRMTRTMMLEVLRQDYIRTAWAKGLRERLVIFRHALKNALIPIVTMIGIQSHILVGGLVIMEQIFCLPGMGRLLVDAIGYRDYTQVSGIMLFFGIVMVLINLAVDLVYAYLDPRIKYK